MPLNMAPPCEVNLSAVLVPINGSIPQPFQPQAALMRWQHSSLMRERESGLLRRAQERGCTDFCINVMNFTPPGFVSPTWACATVFIDRRFSDSTLCSFAYACVAANAASIEPQVHFARARIKPTFKPNYKSKPASLEPPNDPCMHALVLGMLWLVVVWCACAVTLDFAKAVFGAMLHLATAPPVIYMHAISCFMNMCMLIITTPHMISLCVSMTLISLVPVGDAAGKDHPSTNTLEYFLPGVFRWDGVPFHDFRRIWWVALCAALGSVSQDSYSLLQTARDEDLGSPGTGGTAAQRVQSDNRNQRLFGAILNYIEATSYIYRYASANFNNNGRGLFDYL